MNKQNKPLCPNCGEMRMDRTSDGFYNCNECNHYVEAPDCSYCENNKFIFKDEKICRTSWAFGGDVKIKISDSFNTEYGVVIDRGHLRLVNTDDWGCMDHGENVKINYCPFCGKEL